MRGNEEENEMEVKGKVRGNERIIRGREEKSEMNLKEKVRGVIGEVRGVLREKDRREGCSKRSEGKIEKE